MDTSTIILILPTMVVCGVCALVLMNALRMHSTLSRPDKPTKRVMPPDTPITPAVQPVIARAEALGLAIEDILSITQFGSILQMVVMANPARTIYLSINNMGTGVLAQFETWWEGRKVLVTRWPQGESIEQPDLISHFAYHSLESAWDYHQKRLAQQSAVWGDPLAITDEMVDVLQDHYHHHMLPREMERLKQAVRRWIGMLAAAFVVCLLSAPFFLSFNSWPGFGFMLGGMLLAALATKNYIQATIPNAKNAVDEAEPAA